MPSLIRLRSTGPQWPYSVAQFRADEPRLSISQDPHSGELASYADLEPPILVFQVQPTDPPAHDPAAQRLLEVMPVELDGQWQQAWELIDLPPTPPEPQADWLGFAGWLYSYGPMADGMEAARASRDPQGEPATTGLPAAMDEARLRSNYVPFALSWGQFIAASGIPSADLTAIVARAQDCHLPQQFVEALGPVASEQP